MKKILTPLTGIVIIITILFAGACKDRTKSGEQTTATRDDPTSVSIYLKDTFMNGSEHLLMYDSKKPHDKVIDSLETVVYPGDTVVFKKAHKSDVKEVTDIRLVLPVFNIYSETVLDDSGLYVFRIDTSAPWDTRAKYEIDFIVKQDTTLWNIDPHLVIPPEN